MERGEGVWEVVVGVRMGVCGRVEVVVSIGALKGQNGV